MRCEADREWLVCEYMEVRSSVPFEISGLDICLEGLWNSAVSFKTFRYAAVKFLS
jgi:hypothetical protein